LMISIIVPLKQSHDIRIAILLIKASGLLLAIISPPILCQPIFYL
jgi:hypothetical protein